MCCYWDNFHTFAQFGQCKLRKLRHKLSDRIDRQTANLAQKVSSKKIYRLDRQANPSVNSDKIRMTSRNKYSQIYF